MSTISIGWRQQTRVFGAGDFPLSIGGASCHLQVPDVYDRDAIAYLGQLDGDLFIQPAEEPDSRSHLSCNGVALTASRWLGDGDELMIGSTRVRVAIDGDQTHFIAEERSREQPTTALPEVTTRQPPSTISIAPTAFVPRWQQPERRRGIVIRPRALVVAATLGLLAICAWFVLTAHAVQVETDPPAASVALSGGLLTPKFGDHYLLRPGTYTVSAELEGYLALSESLDVGRDTPPVVRYTLEALGGTLSVRSIPVETASVSVDGRDVGTTPLDGIELSAGEHTVEVSAARHLPFSKTVVVNPGDQPIELAAELEPNWAPVTVASTPSGANISVDGIRAGSTPTTLEVESGERVIQISKPGFKSWSRRIQVATGVATDLGTLRLAPVDGRLAVISEPPGATVTVDAEYRGTTPLEVEVAPNTPHDLRISLAGHATYNNEVLVASGARSEVRAQLEVLTGEVVITSEPPGAEVLINGEPRGTTNQTLELKARPQVIELRLEGYVPYRTTITPEPGLTQAVQAAFKLEGPAGLAQLITSPQGVELVLVGPGRFTMGASRREPGRRANEVLREVEITRPYYLAVREVSNQEFREFKPSHQSGAFGGQNLEIDHHPAVNLTWEEAARYCNWLSEKAGLPPVYAAQGGTLTPRNPPSLGYRLPTEAEWAWAARYADSSQPRKYGWGESLPVPPRAGNYGDESAAGILRQSLPGYRDGHPATSPVGSYQANPLGIFNLGGNVSEWVQDIYSLTPTAPGTVERDPVGPRSGPFHVIRGASWMDTAVTELRLSYRDYGNTTRPDVGFRIARGAQ
jgi:formylglycine-generating enzyme required for sulfatase activity